MTPAVAMMLLGLFGLGAPADRQIHVERLRVDGWTVKIASDRFDGRVACRAVRGELSATPGLVTVRLAPSTDTTDALYALDRQPARPWKANLTELAAAGATLDTGNLENPSNGIVMLPSARLGDAQLLSIRPAPGARTRTFELRGLAAVLDLMARRRCGR